MKSHTISEKDFVRLSRLITTVSGIKIPPSKKAMVQVRLQKRLRQLEMSSFDSYCEYLFSPEGMEDELTNMLDVVTTNKTEFFRETSHFDFLSTHVLPDLMRNCLAGVRRPLRVWSAACSTGNEAYTIAMVLSNFGERQESFDYSVLATDLSTRVLDQARTAIYSMDKIEAIPPSMRGKYLLKSRDRSARLIRIAPEIRGKVTFRRINLMDEEYGIGDSADIVFLRNVLIYFDKPTQEKVIQRIAGHMKPWGYLFIGHSETLHGLDIPFCHVAPTIYQKKGE